MRRHNTHRRGAEGEGGEENSNVRVCQRHCRTAETTQRGVGETGTRLDLLPCYIRHGVHVFFFLYISSLHICSSCLSLSLFQSLPLSLGLAPALFFHAFVFLPKLRSHVNAALLAAPVMDSLAAGLLPYAHSPISPLFSVKCFQHEHGAGDAAEREECSEGCGLGRRT